MTFDDTCCPRERGTSLQGLMEMCCWMGSHFNDWIDNLGVAFSIKLLEWGRTFSDFSVEILHIYS